ncbi:MAG: FHA domain-containing protein [Ignavibacterium sp.]|nr:FHA domain-containing protein [Ignavibacterium sp.]
MTLCPKCQTKLDTDSIFCTNCGFRVGYNENPQKVIKIGRGKDNDIVVENQYVSKEHAIIKIFTNSIVIEDLNSTNGTFINGKKISSSSIKETDEIILGKNYILDIRKVLHKDNRIKTPIEITNKNIITIGRSQDNDIVLDNIKVSRHHAKLERIGNDWFIEDLGSANKTYINSKPVKRIKINSNDVITIGGIPLLLENLFKSKREISGDVTLTAKNLSFIVDDKTIIDNISLTIYPGEFVGLIGPSGAGKTSLMLMMNGIVKPTNGDVFINSQSIFSNFDSFKGQIGYVPQDDIIHRELKVKESLEYTAKLRINNYTDTEIEPQVNRVIKTLNLSDATDTLIGSPEKKGISGGQRKRVNLGQELLTEPSILFLDEPTSGLDPKTDMDVMKLLKSIADRGKIVILTTHNITEENFNILTHLVVLTKGGKLAYFGPANEAVKYFQVDKPYEIFDKLNEKPTDFWQSKYKNSNYYKNYVESRQSEKIKQLPNREKYNSQRREIDLKQFFTLSSRYLKIKLRDRISTLILLLQAPLIAFLISLVFSNQEGKVSALFVLTIAAIWLGCSNAAREIVSEQSIYKRERMVFLKIPSYILSKVFILSILCLIQSIILSFITISSLELKSGFVELTLFLFLVSLSSLMIGLFVSSFVKTNEAAMGLMPIILIPQVILGGLISKFADMSEFIKILAGFMISRWAFEGALIIEFGESNNYIINSIGFNPDNLPLDLTIIVLFVIIFYLLVVISLKKKDIQ